MSAVSLAAYFGNAHAHRRTVPGLYRYGQPRVAKWLADQGLKINGSNLCTEIFLPTNEERTAVCCLSSVNLEYFDQWKHVPQFIEDVMEFLDNVLQYFIDHAPDTIARARLSAMRERSVGLGAMGFHAYLQKNGIAFESVVAKVTNMAMFRHHPKRMRACRQGSV